MLLSIVSVFVYAVDANGADASLVSKEKIRDKITEIKDTNVLDDEAKNNLLSIYSKTLDSLDALKNYQSQISSYQQTINKAPAEIKKGCSPL